MTHITSAGASLAKTNHTSVPGFKESGKRDSLCAWQEKQNTDGQHDDNYTVQSSSDAESPGNSPMGFNPVFT